MEKAEIKEEFDKMQEDVDNRKYMDEKHQRQKRVAMK